MTQRYYKWFFHFLVRFLNFIANVRLHLQILPKVLISIFVFLFERKHVYHATIVSRSNVICTTITGQDDKEQCCGTGTLIAGCGYGHQNFLAPAPGQFVPKN